MTSHRQTLTLLASLLVAGAVQASTEAPTFTEDVAPLVFNKCTSCHRTGEAPPFPFLDYNDVKKRARLITEVTSRRYMPPWHPQPVDVEYTNNRSLTDAEIDLLRRWYEAGAPEGDPAKLPAVPEYPQGWDLGTPDLVVSMPQGFTVPADGPDIYRNFVVPLNLKEKKWVKAIEFKPGAPSIVHHSLFYYDNSGTARQMDGEDGKPGFRQMGQVLQRGRLGGWAVGGKPAMLPHGLAYELPAGSDLILSTHFHPCGRELVEISTIGIYFTDEPPTRGFTGVQLPPVFGALAGVDIPAGDSHYTKEDSFVLPVDVDAFGISAHAHYLGKEMSMSATLPDGSVKHLLQINNWDFAWQEPYTFKHFVRLPAGTRVDASVVWDNSDNNVNNPHSPPVRVRWGRESTDEMGSVTLQVAPVNPADLNKLNGALNLHRRESAREKLIENFTTKKSDGDDEQRAAILKAALARYDKDGDGHLSDSEREAAREELSQTEKGRRLIELYKRNGGK